MAEVDFARFAGDVRKALGPLSYRAAIGRWPELNKALISRALNGNVLSAGNFLALCDDLGLDPYAYLDRVPKRRIRSIKDILNQAVTAPVTRETAR